MFTDEHNFMENLFQNINISKFKVPQTTFKYKLIITGSIGVGKSTICEMVARCLNKISIDTNTQIISYPEYIASDSTYANKQLQKRLNNEITAFEFQQYILDCWEYLLKQNQKFIKEDKNVICIYERTPEDSVCCFAYMDHVNKVLNTTELQELSNRCYRLMSEYNIPSVCSSTLFETRLFNNFDTCLIHLLMAIINEIQMDILEGNESRIVLIQSDPLTSMERIKRRNREGEEIYSYSTINDLHNRYKQWFSYK